MTSVAANVFPFHTRAIASILISATVLMPMSCRPRTESQLAAEGDDIVIPVFAREPAKNLKATVDSNFRSLGFRTIDAQGNEVSDDKLDSDPDTEHYISLPRDPNGKFPKFVLRLKTDANDEGNKASVDVNVLVLRAQIRDNKVTPDLSPDGEIGYTSFTIDPNGTDDDSKVSRQVLAFEQAMKEISNKVSERLRADAISLREGALYAQNEAPSGEVDPGIAKIQTMITTAATVVVVLALSKVLLRAVAAEVFLQVAKFVIKSPFYLLRLFGTKGKIIVSGLMIGGLIYVGWRIKERYFTPANVEAVKKIGQGVGTISP